MVISGMGILTEVFIPFSMTRHAKKEYASNSFSKKEHTYTITSTEITSAIENSYSKVSWEDVFLFYETKKYLFVYLSENQTLILPKRVFNNEEIKDIIGWAKENLDVEKIKINS